MKNAIFTLLFIVCISILISHSKLYSLDTQLLWSTYCGGSNLDYGISVAVDQNGNVYATGVTTSNDFPISSNAFQTYNAGDSDIFVIKFNSSGQKIWATYYGGSGSEQGRGIYIDNNGDVIITGITNSTNFPVSNGAFQSNNAGNYDLFVVKFNSQGQRLWATYYGGTGDDEGYGISTDINRNIFISGFSRSTNFPVTTGAFQSNNAGGQDAVIVKFNSQGQRVWATYYGGNSDDDADAITVDINGNVLLTGVTSSTNFPISSGAFQTFNAGVSDAFVLKFTNNGQRLWATYYGGTGNDYGYGGITTDSKGNITFGGWTLSQNFPVSVNAFQTTNAGNYDAFIVNFDSIGQRLWATYYGGSDDDRGEGISVDSGNNIIISGFTESVDFPITNGAYQPYNAGIYDAFIAKFNLSGQRMWSTYFGGTDIDQCYSLTASNSGNLIITGRTHSTNFPISINAFQANNAGGDDAFISVLRGNPIGIISISNSIPEKYLLFQNYPNPFNPSTKIRFDIPAGSNRRNYKLRLVIYNLLGREVSVLVNQPLPPGSYEVEWDGTNYPSGTYFYKLESGDFTATSKMILLK